MFVCISKPATVFAANFPANPLSMLLAQSGESANSNCILTQVGDPQSTPTECYFGPSAAADKIVRAAEDLLSAYQQCGQPPGYTGNHSSMTNCLIQTLTSFGYDNQLVQTAIYNYRGLISAPPNAPDKSVACSQCVGYVDTVLALIDGHGYDESTPCASILNSYPDGFHVGGRLYERVGSGNSTQIYSGDIGVNGDGSCSNSGHILVVLEETGGVSFTALESNYHLDCVVTTGESHLKEKYTFYRRQD